MAKKEPQTERTLSEMRKYLTDEIAESEAILNDPFLRSNMQAMDLGNHAIKIEYYRTILNKLESF